MSITERATWLRANPVLQEPALEEDALSRYVAGFYNSFALDSFDPSEARELIREIRAGNRSLEWLANWFVDRELARGRFECGTREYSLLHLAVTGRLPEASTVWQTCAYLEGMGNEADAAVEVALASKDMMDLLNAKTDLVAHSVFEDLPVREEELATFSEVSRPRAALVENFYRSDERFTQARADFYLGQPLYFWYWQQLHQQLQETTLDRTDLEETIINIDWSSGTREHLLQESAFSAPAFLALRPGSRSRWSALLGRDVPRRPASPRSADRRGGQRCGSHSHSRTTG